MPDLPNGCEYPACECTYPNCLPKRIRDAERREDEESKRQIAYIDQRTRDFHEWRNRD